VLYRQGYLAKTGQATIRVRCGGGEASLTVKSPRRGLTRDEYSYPIPIEDAEAMLAEQCANRVLTKTRFLVPHRGMTWHVDVYEGAASGLVIAEIELAYEGEPFARPAWLGAEVSHKSRYQNSNIALWRAGPARPVAAPGEEAAAAVV
jgi:CYTH domain-containing protein